MLFLTEIDYISFFVLQIIAEAREVEQLLASKRSVHILHVTGKDSSRTKARSNRKLEGKIEVVLQPSAPVWDACRIKLYSPFVGKEHSYMQGSMELRSPLKNERNKWVLGFSPLVLEMAGTWVILRMQEKTCPDFLSTCAVPFISLNSTHMEQRAVKSILRKAPSLARLTGLSFCFDEGFLDQRGNIHKCE